MPPKILFTTIVNGLDQHARDMIRQMRDGFDNASRVARGERPLWLLPELKDMEMRRALRSLILRDR